MPVLVIENEAGQAEGFEYFLTRLNIDCEVVPVFAGAALPTHGKHNAIIVTGGTMGVMDRHQPAYAYLEPQSDWLAEAAGRDIPVLGVCLGHQMLAHALGGEVLKSASPEYGWLDVALSEAGRNDPLFAGIDRSLCIFVYHNDEVTRLPSGAVSLASTPDIPNHAFRYGDKPVWGVQFHPDYHPAIVEAFIDKPDYRAFLSGKGYNVDAMLAEGRAVYDATLNQKIFENFLTIV